MIACKLKNGRVIDFEGSKNSGIQQASYIDFVNFDIINYSEFLCSDGVFSDWLITNTSSYKIDYWVAHNANVEKNLIKDHAPYRANFSTFSKEIQWGPWIDTLTLYQTLYPNLQDFRLQILSKEFLISSEIDSLVEQLCNRTGKKFHQSMFDSIITFLLLRRLRDSIDLSLFMV